MLCECRMAVKEKRPGGSEFRRGVACLFSEDQTSSRSVRLSSPRLRLVAGVKPSSGMMRSWMVSRIQLTCGKNLASSSAAGLTQANKEKSQRKRLRGIAFFWDFFECRNYSEHKPNWKCFIKHSFAKSPGENLQVSFPLGEAAFVVQACMLCFSRSSASAPTSLVPILAERRFG